MAQQQKPKNKIVKKKKNTVSITSIGKAVINTTYNNTIISITNAGGDAICWSTPGMIGFTGARTATPYAATLAAEDAAKKAMEKGVNTVEIITKGAGSAKVAAIKGIKSGGLKVTSIKDVTPIPHNGCRAKKRRRM